MSRGARAVKVVVGGLALAGFGVLFWWGVFSLLVDALGVQEPKTAGQVYLENEDYQKRARLFLAVDNSVENPVNRRLYAVSE